MRIPEESLPRRLAVSGALRCGCWCCLYPASHHMLSAQSLQSRLTLCDPTDYITHQAPLSMGFSRQEYWSGLPHPPPGDLPHPGIKPVSLMSPALVGRFFTTEPPGKPHCVAARPSSPVSTRAGKGWVRVNQGK